MISENTLILRNGSLLDTRAGAIVGTRDVVFEKGRIAEVSENAAETHESANIVAARQRPANDRRSHEPRRAGNEDAHVAAHPTPTDALFPPRPRSSPPMRSILALSIAAFNSSPNNVSIAFSK